MVLIFRMWDFNFGTWISHSGLHMIQEAHDFIVSEGHEHPLVIIKTRRAVIIEICIIIITLNSTYIFLSLICFKLFF